MSQFSPLYVVRTFPTVGLAIQAGIPRMNAELDADDNDFGAPEKSCAG